MTRTRFAAAVAATLMLAGPALAEGNNPAAVETPLAAHITRGGGTDAGGGNEAYPAFAAARSTTVVAGTGLLLPGNGGEGPVQTAVSLPPAALEDTVAYVQAQSVARALAGLDGRTALPHAVPRRRRTADAAGQPAGGAAIPPGGTKSPSRQNKSGA